MVANETTDSQDRRIEKERLHILIYVRWGEAVCEFDK